MPEETTTSTVDEHFKFAPQVFHQPTLLGGAENIKLLFDEELDDRRETRARARAWEAISLHMAQTATRRAQNAATFDKAADTAVAIALATAETENEQTVSPAGTAASETTKGAVAAAGAGEAVSAEAVTANVANLFTATIPVIASALATAISQTLAAALPVLVTAIGGASTPSKPATS